MKQLRILSYNIHKGFSGGGKKFTLPQIRDSIRKLDPDLIFLQEVHGDHTEHRQKIEDWPELSQFEFLAESMWPHFIYGKNAIYSEGHHGNAILSKSEILKWENIDISQNPFEQRGLLHAVIHLDDERPHLHVMCTHLNLFHAGRVKQINQIKKRIETLIPNSEPLILAGDFNDWRSKIELPLNEAFLNLYGAFAKTFPAQMPFLTLDRLYFRGFEVHSAKTLATKPWKELSDHAPIFVELNLF
jgi:endonuclease/exonuclease/phosphatase family metal-dependent hydrolase